MTNKEYIQAKLRPFGIDDAVLVDISLSGIDLEAYYDEEQREAVGKALCEALADIMLAPRVENVSESGFSMSWKFDDVAKYYMYLCNKFGVTPNANIVDMSGLNVIKDATNLW